MLVLRHRIVSAVFLVCALLYLAQSVFYKATKVTLTKYHLTERSALAITLAIALPYLVIWLVALVGYLRLKVYTESIQDSKDGEAFTTIAQGILVLALWLPVSAITGNLVTHIYNVHPSLTADMVRLNNYVNLLMLFPAFWLINQGSQKLLKVIKKPLQPISQKAMAAFIMFSALYVFLVLQDPVRHMPDHANPVASYYQADWLIVITIIIPRLIMWFLGMQAVMNMYLYRQKTKGSLYKSALGNLANGFGAVVLLSVVLRCVQSLTTLLNQLSLALVLLFIYVLLIMISIGYLWIAQGAKSLQRIEEL